MLIDIDDLARVNEAYGQLQGDDVLWAVARVLQHRLRGGDVVGRYRGDGVRDSASRCAAGPSTRGCASLQAAVARLRSPVRNDPESSVAVTVSAGIAAARSRRDRGGARRGGRPSTVCGSPLRSAAVASADETKRGRPLEMDFDRFVGRVDRLRKLVGWLDAACRGDGRLVTIVGEAGE